VRFQEKVVLMVPRARSSSPRMLCRRSQTARLDGELVALRARRGSGWPGDAVAARFPPPWSLGARRAQETHHSPEHAAPRRHSAVRQRVS
jgi:hypothetical protein